MMTFEERVQKTIGDLHFANMQLMHRVEQLQAELIKALSQVPQKAEPAAGPTPEPVTEPEVVRPKNGRATASG